MDTLDTRKQAMFCTTYPYYRHLVYMPGKLGAVSSVYVCVYVCICSYIPLYLRLPPSEEYLFFTPSHQQLCKIPDRVGEADSREFPPLRRLYFLVESDGGLLYAGRYHTHACTL